MIATAQPTERQHDELREALLQLEELDSHPLRSVFARRAMRAVVGLSQQMAEASLKEAVAASSDYGVLLTALETGPGLLLLNRDDPLAEARLRGLRARRELLEKEGGTLTAQEVANLLNISRQAVHKRHRAGRLLAVDCGRHGHAYPAWQFTAGGVLPGLEQVLGALSGHDSWMQLAFFVSENTALDGDTPLAALRRNALDAVLRAARLYGQHGAV
jgi:hypothetical protein